MNLEPIDVAILGGGPAGLQAALVLSRTRKKIVVFDEPRPPRNAASHGVHNMLGLEGLPPTDIRELVWKQIATYQSAELRREEALELDRDVNGRILVTTSGGNTVSAAKALLAVGYHDVYPNVPGFRECWADTIIPCPFCDGYENRDRAWGLVPNSAMELARFPKLAQNWTSDIRVIVKPELTCEPAYRTELAGLGIAVHDGTIAEVHQRSNKVEAISLDGGERIEVGTLLWIPEEAPSPLIEKMVANLGLQLDDDGYVKTDDMQATNVEGLWAAGDVQGWTGGMGAAAAGGVAAHAMVHSWYA